MSSATVPLITRAERRWLIGVSLIVLALASLPYLFGAVFAGSDRVFSGLQVNPLDGLSYLAKMRLGWRGEWTFHLLFTPERSAGGLLFTYFIALGQAARVTGLSLIVMFHLARLLGGFALLWMLYEFIARLARPIDLRRRMWWVVALSSGVGWLAALAGYTNSSDLTIPESNTFYSLIANAHFALATAIMLGMFLIVLETTTRSLKRMIVLSGLSLALAVVQPFAPFAVYGILGVALLAWWRRDRIFPRWPFAATFVAGLITAPLLLGIYLTTQADPLLRAWSLQNQTPSPPPLDYVLGYGLLWVLAFFGARAAWRRRSLFDLLLIIWIVITLPLLYAPIPLQRRLALGLHVPIGVLAAWGATVLVRAAWPHRALIGVTLLTSVFVELVLLGGAAARDPRIYLTTDEAAALHWLEQNAPVETVVLASPEMGAFVPALAGQRVVYGHPYETVNAQAREQEVTDFFAGALDRVELLRRYAIGYVLIGPRERQLGQIDPAALPLAEVFASGNVKVYRVTSSE